ncbi:MAG: hypothetical protein C7B43_11800 [Sulfobacillus benefaciens]|uniref:Probable transposase IS891/IS1136/IS1341 domain-containing protein n=1 Tax=Sulfobacillus benefaciens TaxID=453960 RepID=A0A2T2WYU5_9FIRM|nr:MAG: hypothetical protein C7B43_11800 [Sulfobacillus benefaciens]
MVQFVCVRRGRTTTFSIACTALAIDLGLANLATCVNGADETSFVIDGKALKSLNHQYHVLVGKLQSILRSAKVTAFGEDGTCDDPSQSSGARLYGVRWPGTF